LRGKLRGFIKRAKTLQGDPHYIAVGMAIGVFVGVTPTIPFHTVLAVALAFILKGSKPAAIIGVWFANPITIPIFYVGSYRLGMLILGNPRSPAFADHSMASLLQQGVDVTVAMISGGILLGIMPGIVAYIITRRVFTAIRSRREHVKER